MPGKWSKLIMAGMFSVFAMQSFADNQHSVSLEEQNKTTISRRSWIADGGRGGNSAASSQSLIAGSAGSSQSDASAKGSQAESPNKNDYRSLLEFKAGYFFFANSKMRRVYNHGGLDVQLSGVTPVWRWLHIYGSVEYLQKHGKSLHGHQKTNIWEVPLSLGLQAVGKIGKITQYYFTIGPRYVFAHVHNKSHFVDKSLNDNGIGGFANAGFRFFQTQHFFWDIFGEYSYCRLHFHPHKKNVYRGESQVGGFVFGGGIGYAF